MSVLLSSSSRGVRRQTQFSAGCLAASPRWGCERDALKAAWSCSLPGRCCGANWARDEADDVRPIHRCTTVENFILYFLFNVLFSCLPHSDLSAAFTGSIKLHVILSYLIWSDLILPKLKGPYYVKYIFWAFTTRNDLKYENSHSINIFTQSIPRNMVTKRLVLYFLLHMNHMGSHSTLSPTQPVPVKPLNPPPPLPITYAPLLIERDTKQTCCWARSLLAFLFCKFLIWLV